MSIFQFRHLKDIYEKQLEPNQEYTAIFDCSYNEVPFSMLITTDEQDVISLYFIKVGTREELSFDIDNNFSINTYVDDLYSKLIEFFNIQYNDNHCFRPFEFFLYIDRNAKLRPFNKTLSRFDTTKIYKLNNPDAVYYHSMVNWDNTSSKKHFSKENRDKVKKLLPQLFEHIKDKNISVRFTNQSKAHETEEKQYLDDIK